MWRMSRTWLEVIAGLLTLITATLGLVTINLQRSNEAAVASVNESSAEVDSLKRMLRDKESTISTLESEIESTTAERDALRDELQAQKDGETPVEESPPGSRVLSLSDAVEHDCTRGGWEEKEAVIGDIKLENALLCQVEQTFAIGSDLEWYLDFLTQDASHISGVMGIENASPITDIKLRFSVIDQASQAALLQPSTVSYGKPLKLAVDLRGAPRVRLRVQVIDPPNNGDYRTVAAAIGNLSLS